MPDTEHHDIDHTARYHVNNLLGAAAVFLYDHSGYSNIIDPCPDNDCTRQHVYVIDAATFHEHYVERPRWHHHDEQPTGWHDHLGRTLFHGHQHAGVLYHEGAKLFPPEHDGSTDTPTDRAG